MKPKVPAYQMYHFQTYTPVFTYNRLLFLLLLLLKHAG